MLCVGQFQGSMFNSFNNNTVGVSFRKTNIEYIKLGGALSNVEMPRGVSCNTYDTIGNVDATFKRNFVDFICLRNNTVDLNAGISLSTDGASINELSSKPFTDLTLQRAGTDKMKIYDTYVDIADDLVLKQNKKAYFNVEIGKDAYIHSYVENSATILGIINKETIGQVRIGIDDNVDVITVGKNVISLSEDVAIVTGKGMNCDETFCNIFDSRYTNADIAFQHKNTAYMFFDYDVNKFKFLVKIESNQAISCLSLTKTSDKRLKENIEDIETECSELVRKIPVRKYFMKDAKKKIHNVGFVANEILDAIPQEMENVVNIDNEFMSVN